MELFFLASYDLDGFRDFVASAGFGELFELDPADKQELLQDDVQAAALRLSASSSRRCSASSPSP